MDFTIGGIQGEKSHPGFRVQKPGKEAEPPAPRAVNTPGAEFALLLALSVSPWPLSVRSSQHKAEGPETFCLHVMLWVLVSAHTVSECIQFYVFHIFVLFTGNFSVSKVPQAQC